jgi:hypothetical protein
LPEGKETCEEEGQEGWQGPKAKVLMLRRIAYALAVAVASLASFASGASADACPNEQLRAETHSTSLPDCRAYEMVSPVDKNGGDVFGMAATVRSSTSGEKVAYISLSSFGEATGSSTQNEYLSSRSAGSWATQNINPVEEPESSLLNAHYELFTEDLSAGVLSVHGAIEPGAPKEIVNVYRRDNLAGSYELMTTFAPAVNPGPFQFQLAASGSADLSHVAFESASKLTADAPDDGAAKAFESVDGHLRLAGIMPNGEPAPSHPGERDSFIAGETGGGPEPDTNHSVSADGSRVIFGTGENFSGPFFVRENGTTTIPVSASQRTTPDPAGPQLARFSGASADVSKVLFTSKEELTNDANTGIADSGNDLYEYDLASGVLTDLSPGGEVYERGVIAMSQDASYVYFVARTQLAAGGTSGQEQIYLRHDGVTAFVAPLPGAEERLPAARVSPDGRHLVFLTAHPVTSYENAGHAELYLYDAPTGLLRCASCNPSGAPATSDASFGAVAEALGIFQTSYLTRAVSDDGTRVFFDTGEALVPQDVNGKRDVYEYEEGQLHLISSGEGNSDAEFGDASPSGADVFFLTRDRLVGQDKDDNVDLYDAKIGGGYPDSGQAAGGCEGEACRASQSPAPTFATPGSSSVGAGGNVISAPQPTSSVKSSRTAAQARAQQLARALKACRSKPRGKRRRCEAQARTRYGAKPHGARRAKRTEKKS